METRLVRGVRIHCEGSASGRHLARRDSDALDARVTLWNFSQKAYWPRKERDLNGGTSRENVRIP
jgi:hypothetical protein